MAEMIPFRSISDFKSDAERNVYKSLERQLDNSYLAIHSQDWILPPEVQSPELDQYEGEIDFVIARRDQGILMIEVKGGGISYDDRKDQWYSEGRDGTHTIKDPWKQAKYGQEALYDIIKQDERVLEEGQFYGMIGHAIVFPDITSDQKSQFNKAKLPNHLVLFRENLEEIGEEIEDLFDYWNDKKKNTDQLPKDDWETLEKYLLPHSFQVPVHMKQLFENEEEQIHSFTEDQSELLGRLQHNDRVFVSGVAGSGKTILSIDRAVGLSNEHDQVQWLCYNKNLREHIEETHPDAPFTISHFHAFARRYIDYIADLDWNVPSDQEEQRDFFRNQVPELLLEAAELEDTRYDAMVIDEAQDFHSNWFHALEEVLAENHKLYVFFDPNQSVYGQLPDWLEEPDGTFFPLNKNIRNPREVGEAALELGEIEDDVEYVFEGHEVHIDIAEDQSELPDLLQGAFHELFVEERIDPTRSVVLNEHRIQNSMLDDERELGNYRLTDEPTEANDVQYSTIKGFKGLESDVVIYLQPERDDRDKKQEAYTAASRAKHLLWIITTDPEIEQLIR
jgi:hypothetical protein